MRKRIVLAVVILLVLAVVLYEIVLHIRSGDNVLVVSGRVEANETELSARIPGRLSSRGGGARPDTLDPITVIMEVTLEGVITKTGRSYE